MNNGMLSSHEAEALISEALDRVWVSRIAEKAKVGGLNLKNRKTRVKDISDSVAQAADYRFQIEIAESTGVGSLGFNAVAYHDQNLVKVGEKMIDALTDDGLAVVVAHEVVHLRNRHGEKKLEKRKDLTERLSEAFEEFSEGTQEHKNLSFKNKFFSLMLGVIVVLAIIYLILQGFSRFLETEADTEAVNIARRAGFNVEAGMDELIQVLRETGHISSLTAIVAGHPSTKARERRMKKALEGNWPPERPW